MRSPATQHASETLDDIVLVTVTLTGKPLHLAVRLTADLPFRRAQEYSGSVSHQSHAHDSA
jgi:hypothetical protein